MLHFDQKMLVCSLSPELTDVSKPNLVDNIIGIGIIRD